MVREGICILQPTCRTCSLTVVKCTVVGLESAETYPVSNSLHDDWELREKGNKRAC